MNIPFTAVLWWSLNTMNSKWPRSKKEEIIFPAWKQSFDVPFPDVMMWEKNLET